MKDEELHRKLGDLLYAQKQYDGAIREYNALVYSNPVDKAGAEFSLAQAYLGAGKKERPRRVCWPRLKLHPAIARHKSCCSNCKDHHQKPTDKDGTGWLLFTK